MTSFVREKLRKLQHQGKTVASLSKRAREVIKLIAQGRSSKEIDRIMDISSRTVDTYRKLLLDKLDLRRVSAA